MANTHTQVYTVAERLLSSQERQRFSKKLRHVVFFLKMWGLGPPKGLRLGAQWRYREESIARPVPHTSLFLAQCSADRTTRPECR